MARRSLFRRIADRLFGGKQPEPPPVTPPPPPPKRPPGGAPPTARRAGTATVILEGYGPLTLEIFSPNQMRIAGVYYNAVGWMLRGGSTNYDYNHYASRIESLEGYTFSGRVIGGPSQYVGTYIRNEPLETSPDMIADWANQVDLVSDANKPGSG